MRSSGSATAAEVRVDLQGRVCLVTGGTSGIGAATVRSFAAKGAHVIAASRGLAMHAQAQLPGLAEEHGVTAKLFTVDVANPAECRSCIDQIVEEFGRIDVLVHSAGGAVPGGLFEV